MVRKKKLVAAIFAGLFATIFVVGVFGQYPYVKDSIERAFYNDSAAQQSALSGTTDASAYSMPSVGSRWWEAYSSSYTSTTSSSYTTLSGMTRSCYLPHDGHLEVRLSVEYAVTNSDNCEVRCVAVKGTTTYYAVPGIYWLGRGTHTTSIWRSRTLTFAFENLAAGTYTVSIQWRSMISGHSTAADERIMTVTWYIYP